MTQSPELYTARADNVGGTSGTVHLHRGPSLAELGPAPAPEPASSGPQVTVLPTGGPVEAGPGFNPEQLLAMAWSTCLGETLRVILAEHSFDHSSQVSVEVGLHRDPAGGYRFAPRALVTIEGMEPEQAQPLVDAAHARCPVSKLLSGQGSPTVELATPDGHT